MIAKSMPGMISHEIDRLYDYQFKAAPFFESRTTLIFAMGTDATQMLLTMPTVQQEQFSG